MTPRVPSLPRKILLMSYPADDFLARDRVHITLPSATGPGLSALIAIGMLAIKQRNTPGRTTRKRTTFSRTVPYLGVSVPLAPVDRYPPMDASDPGSIANR
jgi:hypothetical protein